MLSEYLWSKLLQLKHYTTIATFFLALLMAVQAFVAPVVYLSFKLQQDYIAKNLCENRNEPITVCYGSCVLRKELKKAGEQESQQANNPQKVKAEVMYCQAFTSLEAPTDVRPLLVSRPLKSRGQCLFASSFIAEHFNPPQG